MRQLIDDPILPRHPLWDKFIDQLCGPECCNFRNDRWTCFGDLRFSEAILDRFGLSETSLQVSLAYFRDHGGFCDCEVVFNVDGAWRHG